MPISKKSGTRLNTCAPTAPVIWNRPALPGPASICQLMSAPRPAGRAALTVTKLMMVWLVSVIVKPAGSPVVMSARSATSLTTTAGTLTAMAALTVWKRSPSLSLVASARAALLITGASWPVVTAKTCTDREAPAASVLRPAVSDRTCGPGDSVIKKALGVPLPGSMAQVKSAPWPAGSGSYKSTPAAVPGPRLVSVSVKRALSPPLTAPRSATSVTPRSDAGTAVPAPAWSSGRPDGWLAAWTVAVAVSVPTSVDGSVSWAVVRPVTCTDSACPDARAVPATSDNTWPPLTDEVHAGAGNGDAVRTITELRDAVGLDADEVAVHVVQRRMILDHDPRVRVPGDHVERTVPVTGADEIVGRVVNDDAPVIRQGLFPGPVRPDVVVNERYLGGTVFNVDAVSHGDGLALEKNLQPPVAGNDVSESGFADLNVRGTGDLDAGKHVAEFVRALAVVVGRLLRRIGPDGVRKNVHAGGVKNRNAVPAGGSDDGDGIGVAAHFGCRLGSVGGDRIPGNRGPVAGAARHRPVNLNAVQAVAGGGVGVNTDPTVGDGISRRGGTLDVNAVSLVVDDRVAREFIQRGVHDKDAVIGVAVDVIVPDVISKGVVPIDLDAVCLIVEDDVAREQVDAVLRHRVATHDVAGRARDHDPRGAVGKSAADEVAFQAIRGGGGPFDKHADSLVARDHVARCG